MSDFSVRMVSRQEETRREARRKARSLPTTSLLVSSRGSVDYSEPVFFTGCAVWIPASIKRYERTGADDGL